MRHLLDLQQRIGTVEEPRNALDRTAIVFQPPLRLAGAEHRNLGMPTNRFDQFGDVALHLRWGAPGVVGPTAEQMQIETGGAGRIAEYAVQGLQIGVDPGHLVTSGLALRMHAAGDVASIAAERSVGEQDLHDDRRATNNARGVADHAQSAYRSSKPLSELVFL